MYQNWNKNSIFLFILFFCSPSFGQEDVTAESDITSDAPASTSPESAKSQEPVPADPAAAATTTPAEPATPAETPADAADVAASEETPATQETVKPSSITIEWYRPELAPSKKKNRTRVIISGIAPANAKVRISKDKIPLISKKGKIKALPTKSAVVPEMNTGVANSDGYFELVLDLPISSAQLPIEVKKGQDVKKFQLNVNVTKNEVKITNEKNLKSSPYSHKEWGAWFGTGVNWVIYTQNTSLTTDPVTFPTIRPGSFFAKGNYSPSETMDFIATASVSPGATTSSDDLSVRQGEYYWTIFALDAAYLPDSLKFNISSNLPSRLGGIVGLQYHLVPFVASVAGETNTVEIQTNDLIFATLGFMYRVEFSRRWHYEMFMRYQLPVSWGSVFEMQPNFAFDGSVGVTRRTAYRLFGGYGRIGLYWYGQWQKYGFTHFDAANSQEITGDQSLFFTNFELRAGLEF